MRPLSEVEHFKSNEFKVWLLYIGPVLLKEKTPQKLFERLSILSYAIRLLLMTRKYADEAESLIRVFLMRTEQEYTDIVFSPNLHSLNHLAWQVRNFGPLWTCSSKMFEAANYLLQSRFTGTVILLPLIIEPYHRNRDTLKQKVDDNYLADLCHRMRNTAKCFERSKLHVSKLPSEYR